MDIPPASFAQRQTGERHYTVLTAPRQSLPEAMGLPPETRLVDIGLCSATTIRGGRRWVQIRCETQADSSSTRLTLAKRRRAALAIVQQPNALSEDQHQQADDYEKANQKNDADRAAEKLEHMGDSLGWAHLLRLGYRRFVHSPGAKADG